MPPDERQSLGSTPSVAVCCSLEGVACSVLMVGGTAAADAVAVWCDSIICVVGAVVSGVCRVATGVGREGVGAGRAFAAARACAAAWKAEVAETSSVLGGAALHHVAVVEVGGGAGAGRGSGLAFAKKELVPGFG